MHSTRSLHLTGRSSGRTFARRLPATFSVRIPAVRSSKSNDRNGSAARIRAGEKQSEDRRSRLRVRPTTAVPRTADLLAADVPRAQRLLGDSQCEFGPQQRGTATAA